jgi:hypothetical protein
LSAVLQPVSYKLRSREPHCIIALPLEAALEILLFGQHAQQPLLTLGRIVLVRGFVCDIPRFSRSGLLG